MLELVRLTGALFWVMYVASNGETVQAFLRDRVSYMDIPQDDLTLRNLTKQTLLRVVARYFEKANPERYSPGDLLELDPLTPMTASSLFKKHFGGAY